MRFHAIMRMVFEAVPMLNSPTDSAFSPHSCFGWKATNPPSAPFRSILTLVQELAGAFKPHFVIGFADVVPQLQLFEIHPVGQLLLSRLLLFLLFLIPVGNPLEIP